MGKRICRLLTALFAICLILCLPAASELLAAVHRPVRPQPHPVPHPPPPPRPHPGTGHRPGPPSYPWRPSVPHIWIELDPDRGGSTDAPEASKAISVQDADGTIVVVPNAPTQWRSEVNVARNSFALSADITLPRTVKSADVAGIRAVFNPAVDGRTAGTVIDRDFTHLTASGHVATGSSLRDVALVQIVLERVDGRVYIQNLDIGLRVF